MLYPVQIWIQNVSFLDFRVAGWVGCVSSYIAKDLEMLQISCQNGHRPVMQLLCQDGTGQDESK